MKSEEIQVEKLENEQKPLTEFQLAALHAAEEELNDLQKTLSEKKYLIDLDKSELEALALFIYNNASWKFTEGLGIVEVGKEMKKAQQSGKLFTTGLAIEAIYYYLSKVEGNGTKTSFGLSIDVYLAILKAIKNGIERIKMDNDKLHELEFVVASRREGIEPAAEPVE